MNKSTTLILGGGVGGLVTANELRRRLPKSHRIVLVDRAERHVFWPSLLWLQVGLRRPDRIARDLARLQRKGIEVVRGDVTEIDPDRRALTVGSRRLEGDYLVLSPGGPT